MINLIKRKVLAARIYLIEWKLAASEAEEKLAARKRFKCQLKLLDLDKRLAKLEAGE